MSENPQATGEGTASKFPPPEKFEYTYKIGQRGRFEGSISISFQRKANTPDKAWWEEVSNAAKLEQEGKEFSKKLGVELGKLGADFQPVGDWAWLKVAAELTGPEFEMDLAKNEDGERELAINMAKVAFIVSGTAPESWFGKHVEAVVEGKVEVVLEPDDVKRLKDLASGGRELVKQNKILAERMAEDQRLKAKIRDLEESIAKQKKIARGRKSAKEVKRLNEMRAKLARIVDKRRALKGLIDSQRAIVTRAKSVVQGAWAGLKSGGSKIIAKAMQTVVGKALQKIILKLIPIVNIASLVVDLFTIGSFLFDVWDGKAQFGFGGEGGSGAGEEGRAGAEGDGGVPDESGDFPKKGQSGRPGSPGPLPEGVTAGNGNGGEVHGVPFVEGMDGGSVTNWDANDQNPAYAETRDPYDKVTLHDSAKRILDSIRAMKDGIHLQGSDLKMLNESIPRDLTADQVNQVIERLDDLIASEHRHTASPEALVGRVLQEVTAVKMGVPPEVPLEGAIQVAGDLGNVKPVRPIDVERAKKSNKKWKDRFDYDMEEIADGRKIPADSEAYARMVAWYQAQQGLVVDGIAGPVTMEAVLRQKGKTSTPAYKKAKEVLDARGNRGQTGQQGKGGGGRRTSEQGDVPKRLVLDHLPVLRKTGNNTIPYEIDPEKLAHVKTLVLEHGDGLQVKLVDAKMTTDAMMRDTGEKEDAMLVIITVYTMEVVAPPPGAPADYKWKAGQQKDEVFQNWYHRATGNNGVIYSADGFQEAIWDFIDYKGGGKADVKPGAGQPHDLDVVTAKIIRVVSVKEHTLNGKKMVDLVVEITPTTVHKEWQGITDNDGTWKKFVVGKSITVAVRHVVG